MKLLSTLVAVVVLSAASQAQAADRRLELSLEAIVDSPQAREVGIDGSVRFFLAGQSHPAVAQRMGEGVSNKKTNAFGKSDEAACRWVTLSVLLALQEAAKARGANAVVDIVSYFKKNTFSSPTHYECHAGALMAGVTLKGTYATLD